MAMPLSVNEHIDTLICNIEKTNIQEQLTKILDLVVSKPIKSSQVNETEKS